MECEIVYLLIARKPKTVLCEYAQYSGNFDQISKKIIIQLNSITDNKFVSIIPYDNKEFYALVENGYIFLVLVDKYFKTNKNQKENDDEWEDCSYYLYEYLYSLKEELFNNYTEAELKQSQAYTLVSFVDVLSASIDKYQMNKTQYKEYTKSIMGITTCQIDYKRKKDESSLSIIKNSNVINDSESNKELLSEGKDKFFFENDNAKTDMLVERNKRKKACCQAAIIISLFIAVLLGLVGIIWAISA